MTIVSILDGRSGVSTALSHKLSGRTTSRE